MVAATIGGGRQNRQVLATAQHSIEEPQVMTNRRAYAQLICTLMAVVPGATTAKEWAQAVSLPEGEKAISLFNGRDLSGWDGNTKKYFSVVDGMIRAANEDAVATSTYLFTKENYRNFRLLLEVKQTRSPRHATTHSAIAALGERIKDGDNPFGFRGPLLMFCNDWGVWDAHRRDRVYPAGHEGVWLWKGERIGEWNQIEVLIVKNRVRMAANGKLVMDFVDDPKMLEPSPIGLQLHSNDKPQEFHFRGLRLVNDPTDQLATLATQPNTRQ
jgi:3-keto-disaccharide hydrolase